MKETINIFWFRRDLRLHDNAALSAALQSGLEVLPIFVFDKNILEDLEAADARVDFIVKSLKNIDTELKQHNSGIHVFHATPKEAFQKIIEMYNVSEVFTNNDYEPYALKRDVEIQDFLKQKNIGFRSYKDQVIFEKSEIVKKDGTPYLVYTPFMKAWKQKFEDFILQEKKTQPYFSHFFKIKKLPQISLEAIGFKPSKTEIPAYNVSSNMIRSYESTRNFPAKSGTSMLGVYLRFGIVSIRKMIALASAESNDTFLNELIWREFFMQVLYHFPETVHEAFHKKYDRIQWRNNEDDFLKWKNGTTGYPLVDAGMRQLNKSGFMHNRVRMLVASFLCKHLLIDWRWGEAYFAEKLLDYELSSNVGNWQWAAGTGVDAAPYFRIFNPTTQINKFDKDYAYIKKWLPEFGTPSYPKPMVDHKEARERCLAAYKAVV